MFQLTKRLTALSGPPCNRPKTACRRVEVVFRGTRVLAHMSKMILSNSLYFLIVNKNYPLPLPLGVAGQGVVLTNL
jgi:hypothetical protein